MNHTNNESKLSGFIRVLFVISGAVLGIWIHQACIAPFLTPPTSFEDPSNSPWSICLKQLSFVFMVWGFGNIGLYIFGCLRAALKSQASQTKG